LPHLEIAAVKLIESSKKAPNQRCILRAFQSTGWAARIDNPLPGSSRMNSKTQMQAAVKSLNLGDKPLPIRFLCDGTGTGIRWKEVI